MTTKRERSKDYKFLFDCVRKAVHDCTGIDYRPSCLIADAAGAITKGFMLAMDYGRKEFSRVICWQHVKRNVDKHLNLSDPGVKNNLKEDINFLQKSQSKELFENSVFLFLKKWESKEVAFIKYF